MRLGGAVPKLVPFVARKGEWRLDVDELRAGVSGQTRVLFIMNPSMPSGAVLNQEEWNAISNICQECAAWLIYDAAIVARRLGIPAVVGCGDATMRLKTGDRVLVNGGRGTVEILDTARVVAS